MRWPPLFSRKIIEIPITDEEAYEKNVIMYVVIGDPRHIAGNDYLNVLRFSYSAPNLNINNQNCQNVHFVAKVCLDLDHFTNTLRFSQKKKKKKSVLFF